MGHVAELGREAAELVARQVKVDEVLQFRYVWGDSLRCDGGDRDVANQ